MPRTPADATRFTSTGPHAHAKPTTATTVDFSSPPANESPAQKVARLRAAANQAKLGQFSTWDRVVLRGRRIADGAHKITTTGLILATITAGGFAMLSLGDMVLTNRRKKKDWFAEQQSNYDRALAAAREAEANGTLTKDLEMFLIKERAVEQAEAEQETKGSLLQQAKGAMFGGLAMEDRPTETLASRVEERTAPADEHLRERIRDSVVASAATEDPTVGSLVADTPIRRPMARKQGGYLDRLAEDATMSVQASTQSWTDWLLRRS